MERDNTAVVGPPLLESKNPDLWAEKYAREARRLLIPNLLFNEDSEADNHPCLVQPLGMRQLREIARCRGVIKFDTAANIVSDGQLIPLLSGGFELRVAAHQGHARARFTIAHEIAHTYFYDIKGDSPRRRNLRSGVQGRDRNDDVFEERFCDSFAAHLLLPSDSARSEFQQLMTIKAPNEFIRNLEEIGKRWGTSTQSTLSKLNDTIGIPSGLIATILRWKPHRQTHTQPTCRVEYFYPRPAGHWYLPSNQRASTIGFSGAITLFEWWLGLNEPLRSRGGAYTLRLEDGGARVLEASKETYDLSERLRLKMKPHHHPWCSISVESSVAYRLYVSGRAKAYCLAMATVPDNCGQSVSLS